MSSKVNLLKINQRNTYTDPEIAAHCFQGRSIRCDKNCTNFQPTKK